jgi:hypothetical protein
MNGPALPDEPLERLAEYQRRREDERSRLDAALAKKPSERTKAEASVVAYSRLEGGTAAGCRCGY